MKLNSTPYLTIRRARMAFPILALLVSLAGPIPVGAEPAPDSRHAEASADRAWAEGEIRRIDLHNGKITLRHGEIRHLDMPPMSMVFTVRDKTRLDAFKVGDRVRFQAIHENTQYLVTEIEALQ